MFRISPATSSTFIGLCFTIGTLVANGVSLVA